MCTVAAAGYAITDVVYGKFMDDDEDAGMEKNFLWIGITSKNSNVFPNLIQVISSFRLHGLGDFLHTVAIPHLVPLHGLGDV